MTSDDEITETTFEMEKRTARDVREQPAYSVGEAGHYLHVPPATLATWALGRSYPTVGGDQDWAPLFKIADRKARRLSFVNLVEAHVLAAIRRDHHVRIPSVRRALAYVKQQLGLARPLCDAEFETAGGDLFVQKYGELINASRQGQLAMRTVLQAHLKRIERDPTGIPIRLYPARPNASEGSRFVAIDPRYAFGRPSLVGSGVSVAVIADRFRGGDSVASLSEDYAVGAEAIEEAIRQAELLRAA